MRPIDADAMVKDLERFKGRSPEIDEVLDMFIKLLNAQPTLELEKGVDKRDKGAASPVPEPEKRV